MTYILGFLSLLLFLLVGETLKFLFGWPVSGGIGGMLLLTVWLVRSGSVSEELAAASRALISALILLIMPGVVGVFFLGSRFSGQWLAIGGALIAGTALSVLTSLLLLRATTKRGGRVV